MNDPDLIDRLLDGDPEVIARVRDWIRAAFAPYRARLASELEDLEQEILLELTTALRSGKFRGGSSLRTYTRTYVNHKSIDRLRAQGRRQWVDIEDLELPSRAPSVFEEMSRGESARIALQVVEEMPEACRELWAMLQEGLRYREMSERVGVSEGTLRARVLRCRRRALEARQRLLAQSGITQSGHAKTR